MEDKKSMINCHAHIFTSKTVPPYLAKSFLPWPFYKIINTDVLMRINEFLKFDQGKWKLFYEHWKTIKIQSKNLWHNYRTFLHRNFIAKTIATIINVWFVIHALYYLLGVQISALIKSNDWLFTNIRNAFLFLESKHIFLKDPSFLYKAIVILFVFFFIEMGR